MFSMLLFHLGANAGEGAYAVFVKLTSHVLGAHKRGNIARVNARLSVSVRMRTKITFGQARAAPPGMRQAAFAVRAVDRAGLGDVGTRPEGDEQDVVGFDRTNAWWIRSCLRSGQRSRCTPSREHIGPACRPSARIPCRSRRGRRCVFSTADSASRVSSFSWSSSFVASSSISKIIDGRNIRRLPPHLRWPRALPSISPRFHHPAHTAGLAGNFKPAHGLEVSLRFKAQVILVRQLPEAAFCGIPAGASRRIFARKQHQSRGSSAALWAFRLDGSRHHARGSIRIRKHSTQNRG